MPFWILRFLGVLHWNETAGEELMPCPLPGTRCLSPPAPSMHSALLEAPCAQIWSPHPTPICSSSDYQPQAKTCPLAIPGSWFGAIRQGNSGMLGPRTWECGLLMDMLAQPCKLLTSREGPELNPWKHGAPGQGLNFAQNNNNEL